MKTKPNCQQLSSAVKAIKIQKVFFDECLKENKMEESLSLKSELYKSIEIIFEKIDPYQIRRREELAKKFGFDYVGGIYKNKVAVGINFDKSLSDFRNESRLIDLKSKKLIGEKYSLVSSFYNNTALAIKMTRVEGNLVFKHCLIDSDGKTLINITNESSDDYHVQVNIDEYEGQPLRVESLSNSSDRFFVDSKGKKILTEVEFASTSHFSDGVIWGYDSEGCSLFDEEGKKLFTLTEKFDHISSSFGEGLCLAYRYSSTDGKSRLFTINKSGGINDLNKIVRINWQTSKLFTADQKFKFGLYSYAESEVLTIIDTSGKVVLETKGHYVNFINEQRAIVCRNGNNYDLIDLPDGNVLQSAKNCPKVYKNFISVSNNTEGISLVDFDGNILSTGYAAIDPPSEGIVSIKDGAGWFCIDEETGTNTFRDKNLRFSADPTGFRDGVATISDADGKTILINREGNEVFKKKINE